jgi:hypothetical protein
MNIEQFIINNDLKSISFPLNEHISENTRIEFNKNRESIIESYFADINDKIDKRKFDELYENQIIFGIYPFNQKNGIDFLNLIKKINLIIKNSPDELTSDLLDFEWTLLDHILHEYLIEVVETKFRHELKLLKSQTENATEFKSEIALLHQKIQHFGIK